MTKVVEGERPKLDESIPKCFKNLIESCWRQNPSERLSFDQIIDELKNNEEFVKDDVDVEVYQHYIKYIDEYIRNYDETEEKLEIEDFFSKIDKTFSKVDLLTIRKEMIKNRKIDPNVNRVPLNYYSKGRKIGEGSFSVVYKVTLKDEDEQFAAKVSKLQLSEMSEDEFISLNREVSIISKIDNPCILNFIGFSDLNFEHEEFPVVITECSPKGSLDRVIQKERQGLADSKWDNTTKLINIYGIAAGMSYLHHQNIIHRDLKPDNILLDDDLYPKIADFGLSKILDENEKCVVNPTYKLKGTPVYCSPEILLSLNYTKKGDVYAFGFIVYEIITSEIPYQNVNYFILIKKIINNERPKFNYPIPSCYRDLIERCWAQNPDDRPTFDQILDELENDSNFINDDVDVDEDAFFDYIQLIKGEDLTEKIVNEKSKAKSSEKDDSHGNEKTEKLKIKPQEDKNSNDESESERGNSKSESHEDEKIIEEEIENDDSNKLKDKKKKIKNKNKNKKSKDKNCIIS